MDNSIKCPHLNELECQYLKALEQRVKTAETENIGLAKELSIKNMIAEILQYHGESESLDALYYRIYQSISNVVSINNFYICLVEDGELNIPFIIDEFDQFDASRLTQASNAELDKSLTRYALNRRKNQVMSEAEILELEEKGVIQRIGRLPRQWIFVPFYSKELTGGIVTQTYTSERCFSSSELAVLNYAALHVGNLISEFKSKQKIRDQYEALKSAQEQLVHSEKMASIGQLAAGVAHEINNPLGYINSNLNALRGYVDDIKHFLDELDSKLEDMADGPVLKADIVASVASSKKHFDVDYIFEDLNELVNESIFGMDKVKKIIQGLKNFSHAGGEVLQLTDINNNIEETIRIIWNELKYHCKIDRHFGEIPQTYCHPNQINQVFMNLLVNAGHAIEKDGLIEITTFAEQDEIIVKIKDNGSGISPEVQAKMFNPFFTTKPIGKGTGLGLSISYGIIESHQGKISVESEPGKGTCFTIRLPVVSCLPENLEDQP